MSAQRKPRKPRTRPGTGGRRHARPELAEAIDYRNPDSLKPFLSARGRIKSRAQTGLSRRDQSRLARAVKRARELALMPYVVADANDGKERRERRERRS